MCKGSCRRTPTEGLAASRRWQPALPVPCRDTQTALPRWAVERKPVGVSWLHNPPCMALPCCPPFAQGGLRRAAAGKTFFAQANTTGKGKESYGSSVTLAPPGARKRSGKSGGRTGPVPGPSYFLCPGGHNRPFFTQPSWLFCGTRPLSGPAWGAKKVGEVRWPDGHIFFAQADTTGKGNSPTKPDSKKALLHSRRAFSLHKIQTPKRSTLYCRARQRSMGPASRWLAAHQISGLASAGRALG